MAKKRKRGNARNQIVAMKTNPPNGSVKRPSEAPKPSNVFLEALQAELDLLETEYGSSPKQHPHKLAGEQRKYLQDPELLIQDSQDFGFESLDQVLLAAQDLASRKRSLTPAERAAWWMCQTGGGECDDNEPINRLLLSLRYARAQRLLRSARGANGSRGNRRRSKAN